jgi:hypothetical protein
MSRPGLMSLIEGQSGDAGFDRKMASFVHAPGTMMIHLALDGLPDWTASDELKSFAYVHIAPSLDQMARTYQQAVAGLLPDEPVLVVGQPTVVDPSRAPEGKHVLWVQVRMVPGEIRAMRPARSPKPTGHRSRRSMRSGRLISSSGMRRAFVRRSSAARSCLRSIWKPTIQIWSAATRWPAAIICHRISCSGRLSAMPREKPPSRVCTSPAPASGRVRVPGRVQAICSPRSWAGNEHPK